MNAKWKIILLVMLIIISICAVFISLFVLESKENLQALVDRETAGIRTVVQTIEEQCNQNYRNRIRSFVSVRNDYIVKAFAERNREKLYQDVKPIFELLKKENKYFLTLGWITDDNTAFLRLHRPKRFGDNVEKLRPDVVAANRTGAQQSGYLIAKYGLQYRIVQPISYQGRFIGTVQFGLDNSMLLDAIYDKLKLPVGMAVANDKFRFVVDKSEYTLANNQFTFLTNQVDLFKDHLSNINLSADQQWIEMNDKTYILVKGTELFNYRNEHEASVFIALDISPILAKLKSRIVFVVFLSVVMLLLSFLLLYSSYGALVQKIIALNQLLEHNNAELESRVQERTAELEASGRRLQKILDNAPVGILLADPMQMSFQYANPQICSMLGYAKEELEQMNLESIHPVEERERVRADFKRKATGCDSLSTDIPFMRKTGEHFTADVLAASLDIDGQKMMIGFIIDRTEHNNLEMQLHRAQKMEAIGLMAGGVAHDLNNILAGIVNYPELMLLKLPKDSPLRPSLEAVRDSGRRAAEVVADLLTVARGAASVRKPHDLNLLIEEYLTSPECKKLKESFSTVSIEKKLSTQPAIIDCAPIHIKKTLMNLVTNAAEALSSNGAVRIITSNAPAEKTIDGLDSGEYVLLEVRDNGAGISKRDLPHIFEPFYTKKAMGRSGSGLGLAVVWNTVQDHKGKVFVESNNAGTSFKLYFPLSSSQEPDLDFEDENEDLTGNRERILVIDDEPQLRDIACQMLRSLNYQVDSVCSGETALKFLQNTSVDLVIIDMLMEPGMNGRETYEGLLRLYPGQKAIIASGYSASVDVKKALEMGAGGYIDKPYSVTQLGRMVKEVLS